MQFSPQIAWRKYLKLVEITGSKMKENNANVIKKMVSNLNSGFNSQKVNRNLSTH